MTYDELQKKTAELYASDEVYTSPDFQCDQTGGFPTSLCVCWEKQKAWLELNENILMDRDGMELGYYRDLCADYGMLHALHWLESAVKDDNPYAEYLLGKTFLKGEDIERDTERAESLLCRSSEQGNKYAAYTLGKAYLDGDILTQNIDEAVRLLNLSATRNFAPAQFILGRLLYKGEVIPKDIKKAVEWLDRAAAQKNPYAAYLAGKIYLTEDEVKNIQKAIRSFIIAAENGNDYAEYQLGKIYLYGKDIPRDTDKAMYYLHLAAEHGNPYAAQLIHSIRVNGNWTAALASLRLLEHMARVIQNRLEDECRGRENSIDRKLRRKIEEKKQAHGLKQ